MPTRQSTLLKTIYRSQVDIFLVPTPSHHVPYTPCQPQTHPMGAVAVISPLATTSSISYTTVKPTIPVFIRPKNNNTKSREVFPRTDTTLRCTNSAKRSRAYLSHSLEVPIQVEALFVLAVVP